MSAPEFRPPPRRGKQDSYTQRLLRRLPYQATELYNDVMDIYDRKKVLTPREKRVLAGLGVILLLAIYSNPSEEEYKKHLNQKISQKLKPGEIKEHFFNKVLYKQLIDDVEKSIDRTNLLFFSVYGASVSLYSADIPDFDTTSIGFMGNFFQTSLNISSPLEESLRPLRKNGKAGQ